MDDLNIQAGVTVNAEQAERAFTNLGDKAQKMANEVTKAADKAGKATDGMGDGAEKGAEKFTRAESRMRAAIQKSTRELEMLGKTASQKFEAQLEFKGLDKAKFQPFLAELRKTEEAAAKAQAGVSGIGDAAKVAGSMMAAAFSGAALLGVVGKVVSVQREFDVLNSSLKTVTGSSAAAERELMWLKDFAKTTPFGLAQATQGFVKMKALGLDPTRAALTSFGNTASAMGKDLNQMIEAVADASTGEFERLKEFGVKAKKEGDNVSLTFQGVTTTIKNSAAEITAYLEKIGNNQFGGAMEERAKTLDGTIAALGDTWDELFRTVSTNNVGGLIFDSVTLANGALEDATTILKAMGGAAQDAGRDTGALGTIQNGIATVFETVSVLGANLKFVLVGIGNEIGGLAAQVAQAAQFNFAGVRAIREQMVADAEAARREIDATTARILNARKAQEEYARYATRNASAATDPRRIDLGGNKPSAGAGSAGKAIKETLSDYDKLFKKLSEELPKAAAEAEAAQMGYNKAQAEFIALAGSEAWAKFSNTQRATVAALYESKIASEQAGDAAKTLAKAESDAVQAREKYLASLATGIDKIKADIAAQEEATARMGLSKEAIAELDAAKLEMLATDLELQAIKAMDRNLDQQTYDSLKEQAKLYRDLAAAKRIGAAKETALEIEKANEEAARKAADDWQRAADDINRSLTDALMRGFESGEDFADNFRKTLENMFKTMVLRPIISAVLSPISGGIQGMMGGLAGGAGGGSNPIGMASNAYSLYNTGSQAWTLGSQYLSGSMSGANALGSVYANATGGGLDALLATNGAYGTAGGGAAGGAGMGALAGAGAFAAVAAVVLNALGAFKSERKVGGGLMGTLGSGSISPWEEWREGGTLFSGPSYSTMNPVAELARARERLAQLEAMPEGQGRSMERIAQQQGLVDQLEKTYGGLAEATAKQSKVIQAAYDAMRDSAGDMADTLGLSSDKVRDFTTLLGGEKGLNFDGLKPEEQQAKLAEALATANNELAQQILGTWETTSKEISRVIATSFGSAEESGMVTSWETLTDTITQTRYVASEYAKDGEKAIDTLTRLASSLSTVNTIWDQLGNDMLQASLAGADAASRIAEAFGGLEAMSATTGSYFQNFYGADEQRDAMRRQIQGQLDKLNLTLPDIDAANAREQYRALAEAQDRNTEEGLKAYVALLQLSGAFASLTQAAQTTTQTLEQQRQAYYGALQDAVSARNKNLQSQLSAAQEVESTLENLFGILRSNVRELYGEVDGTRGMLASQGNAFIDQALATAKASGYLPDADKLAEAISAVRGGIDGGAYTTQFASDRDRLVLAGKLSGLEKITEKQLTDTQKTVRALETQIDQNEQTLDYWKQQIEIASGTYDGILSVEAAVQQLSAALGGVGTTKPGTPTPGGYGGGGGVASSTPRVGYGAEEALTSFEKFKAWYQGLRNNADPNIFKSEDYQVPDWLKLTGTARDGTNQELFGQYQFFKNNSQYAKDFEQLFTTGKTNYATDGSTLVKSDLSKMPAEVAAFFKNDRNSLLSYEGLGLDPVLAYQLYQYGPEMFGLDKKKDNFAEWLRNNKWTEGGIVANNNAASFAGMGYSGYNLTRRDLSTGNIVGLDGILYSKDGKPLGRASQAQLESAYGAGFVAMTGGGQSSLYRSQVGGGASEADYYGAIKTNLDQAIASGKSAQWIADAISSTGASMRDVATAYGITVSQLEENLRNGGATNIPKFDIGTNYVPRDMLAYIHEGEAVVPKAYNPAAGGGGAGGNAELVAEVRALREQNATMAARLEAIEKNTQLMPEMGRQFNQYSNGGTFSRQKAIA